MWESENREVVIEFQEKEEGPYKGEYIKLVGDSGVIGEWEATGDSITV